MAERSTRRRKKKENTELEKPTKEETAVAKHIRFNLPTKSTAIDGHKVEYFTGSKAVDFLQDSKWATGKGGTEILFTDRQSITNYLDGLLWKGLFYRTLKVVKKPKKEGKEKEEGASKKEKKAKKEKKKEAESTEKATEKEETKGDGGGGGEGGEVKDGGKEGTPPVKKKEGKKKIKLELTDDQKFVDGNDAFVWVYDPIRPMNYVFGFGLVIGAVAVCLYPLWPHWMRTGTYYLTLCGAGFVGAILALAVLRLIIFTLTWGFTFGKIHFWLFPNLLADVGIKESFIPFYECDIISKKEEVKDQKSKDDKNGGEKTGDESHSDDQPNPDTSQGGNQGNRDENIPESLGEKEHGATGDGNDTMQSSVITEDRNKESETVEGNEEEEEDDDDNDLDDDEEENGDGFEMIDEEEISEALEGSGGSGEEEEE